jgi:hypothetical protein
VHHLVDELANALQIVTLTSALVEPTLEQNGDAGRARALADGIRLANAALVRLRRLIREMDVGDPVARR